MFFRAICWRLFLAECSHPRADNLAGVLAPKAAGVHDVGRGAEHIGDAALSKAIEEGETLCHFPFADFLSHRHFP